MPREAEERRNSLIVADLLSGEFQIHVFEIRRAKLKGVEGCAALEREEVLEFGSAHAELAALSEKIPAGIEMRLQCFSWRGSKMPTKPGVSLSMSSRGEPTATASP